MRFNRFATCLCVVAVGFFFVPTDVRAQSFFQSLFGGGKAKRKAAPAKRPMSSNPFWGGQMGQNYYNKKRSTKSKTNQPRYRTLCVRMCDGFYWPVSSSVKRSKFRRDANLCQSRCGSGSQLFYHSASEGTVDNMINLRGQAYKGLDIAFRYRKKLVKGCRCRPEPWSHAEVVRHEGYAAKAEFEKLQKDQKAEVKTAGLDLETIETGAIKKQNLEESSHTKTEDAASSVDSTNGDPKSPSAIQYVPKRKWERKKAKAVSRARKRKKKANKNSGLAGWFAPSNAQYRWPGD